MSTTIGTSPISGIGTSYIPELTDTADIQAALKLLYYGSTSAATTSGIYGSLTYLKTSPAFTGNVSIGGTLSVTGNTTVPTIVGNTSLNGNLTVTGDLIVNGTNTVVNTTNLSITDSIIYLSSNQYATDLYDIGFYGAYGTTGGTISNHKHAGLARDHTDGVWKLFSNGVEPSEGTVTLSSATPDSLRLASVLFAGSSAGTTTVSAPATASTYILTLPTVSANDNFVSRTSTDTLTNKTLTSPTISTIINSGTLTLPTSSDTLVGRATTDTLTNKTLTDPVIANIKNSGTLAIKNTSGTTVYTLTTGSTNASYSAGTDGFGAHFFNGGISVNSSGIEITGSSGSKAPITMGSGINLPTLIPGTIEYDGTVFYGTPKVNSSTFGRGLIPTTNIFMSNSDYTPTSVSSTSSGSISTDYYVFGNKGLYLAASTQYFVEMYIKVFHSVVAGSVGSTSASVTFSLKGPNSASYFFDAVSQVDMASFSTSATPTFEFISGLGASKIIKSVTTSTSDTGYSILKWSGFIVTGTSAGKFGPAITLAISNSSSGAASTASATVSSNSWCKVTPVAVSGSDVNIGGWA
jgi:hypothetical protein